MATIGLRNLVWAEAIMQGTEIVGYKEPISLAKAINAGLSITTAQATLYADDSIAEEVREFAGGELTLEVNRLDPPARAAVLGQHIDEDGVVYAGEGDEAPYGAIGFRADRTRGYTKVMWLYKIKFGVPNENYGTKGSSVTFQTPTIVGTIMKNDDGLWKADYDGQLTDPVVKTWFDKVREKNNTPSEPTDPTDPVEPTDPTDPEAMGVAVAQVAGANTARATRNTKPPKEPVEGEKGGE